jgi:hypothetical protein
MANDLTARVRQAKQWQQAARTRSQECVKRSQKLVSKAIGLLEKCDQLEQRATRKLGQLRPAHKKSKFRSCFAESLFREPALRHVLNRADIFTSTSCVTPAVSYQKGADMARLVQVGTSERNGSRGLLHIRPQKWKRRPECGSTMMHHVRRYVHSGTHLGSIGAIPKYRQYHRPIAHPAPFRF